ncbi:SDR family NAD(P)-dependent oxidoreductase [Dyella tabacisoli]|uniref:SDR family NAD(P)-dependent oxidoreductase n=1 Tax=Dyella tabacisoli TaxID=2282381 RepID=A0A369UHC5_9GAMM|nr:glucose 1-dehydrogenase [Dyella tabacisoli]RDD80162.1 SDR family NAD(P)-dependent oxidoreductase [Dyella tabacisoli]
MTQLTHRVAVVTGGSRGIGAAVARKLANLGATVVIVYRSSEREAMEVVQSIVDAGGTAVAFAADVADTQAVSALIATIVARFGHIDILVNNAGIFEARGLLDMDADHVRRLFESNMGSVWQMTKAAVPHFPPTGGRIVNVSSNLIYSPRPGTGMYAASKAAISVLTHAFANELGARGITVNAVAPSMTRTDMTAETPEARRQAVMAATPLGRIGEPSDIADVIAFLASDGSRWVTGRTLLTDGGLTDGL